MHYRITQVRILPPKVIELSIIFGSWIRRGESNISFLFLLGDEMDRQNLYNIYQNNLELLENELGQVKKMTQINLGKLYYATLERKELGEIKKNERCVLGSTRLYTFLLCSWLEARLKKILYESSSVAFSERERSIVLSSRTMSEKWKKCLNISVCKSYGFTFEREINEYIDYFNDCSDEKYCYCKVYEYLGDIEQAVTIRNRLAHGQWKIQLNSNESNLASEEITSFFERYDNIQKLDLLYKVYKLIAEIISSYVVYKDKVLTNNFKQEIKDKIFKIENYQQRIMKSDFDKYCNKFYEQEIQERKCKKDIYKRKDT